MATSEAASSEPSKKRGRPRKDNKRSNPLEGTGDYSELMNALKEKMADVGKYKSPEDIAAELKAERDAAKAEAKEKSKGVKLFARKSKRLAQKAKKLSDEGLLLEFARRQKVKEAKASQAK